MYEASQLRFARAALKCAQLKYGGGNEDSEALRDDSKDEEKPIDEKMKRTLPLASATSQGESAPVQQTGIGTNGKQPKKLTSAENSADIYRRKRLMNKRFSLGTLKGIVNLNKFQEEKDYLRSVASKGRGVLGDDLYSPSEEEVVELPDTSKPDAQTGKSKKKPKSLDKRPTRLPYDKILGQRERRTSGGALLEQAEEVDDQLVDDQHRLQELADLSVVDKEEPRINQNASYYESIEASKTRIRKAQTSVEKPTFRLKRNERRSLF